MKRLFLIGVMILSVVSGFAQDVTAVNNLKEQQKVLELTAKLNSLQLECEQKKLEHSALISKAASINAEANEATTDFTASNPSSTVKDAKDTIKKLKEAKKINKKLDKSLKGVKKLEKKIAQLKAKISKLDTKIQFVDK